MLAWVDNNDVDMAREVAGRLSAVEQLGAEVELNWTQKAPAGETEIELRRGRISAAWSWFLRTATGQVILCAEDDTIPDDPAAYLRLIEHLKAGAIFAQGTEVARQARYIPHWQINGDFVRSGTFEGETLVPIQGGGWYCAAMVTDYARTCSLEWGDLPLGPDVQFVSELHRHGRCVGDWAIECQHWSPDQYRHPALTTQLVQMLYERTPGGGWSESRRPAKPWRRAEVQRTEEEFVLVRVKKPFLGTQQEREKYGDGQGRKIMPKTVMELSDERFRELHAIGCVVPLKSIPVTPAAGGTGAGWAPPVRAAVTPEASTELVTGSATAEVTNAETSTVAPEPEPEPEPAPKPKKRRSRSKK